MAQVGVRLMEVSALHRVSLLGNEYSIAQKFHFNKDFFFTSVT